MLLTEWTSGRLRRLTIAGLSLAVLTVPASAAPALAATAAPAAATAPAAPAAPATLTAPAAPAAPATLTAPAAPAAPATLTAPAALDATAAPALTAGAIAHARARGSGWLRLAHLSPNTPPVDVYLYSFGNPHALVVVPHVAYGTVSAYKSVPTGDYTVAMRAAGARASTKPVLSTSVDIEAGGAYTVAGLGPFKALRLQVMRDRLRTPKGKALVRVIQASLRQHLVTTKAGHRVLVGQQRFATVSHYVAVHPGDWIVRADGQAERTSDRVKLTADSIHTIVILDHTGHLALDPLQDAAGSRITPDGAPPTGLGGTAARPGTALLPWAGALAGGLVLTLAGGLALRRRHIVTRSQPAAR
jgi:hypothetical protein